jgi:hypothetical protein
MTTKAPKPKILMVFHRETDDQLVTTMGAVDDGVYGHPDKFTNLLVDKATFEAQKISLSTAVVAAKDGGRKAIAEKNKQRWFRGDDRQSATATDGTTGAPKARSDRHG